MPVLLLLSAAYLTDGYQGWLGWRLEAGGWRLSRKVWKCPALAPFSVPAAAILFGMGGRTQGLFYLNRNSFR